MPNHCTTEWESETEAVQSLRNAVSSWDKYVVAERKTSRSWDEVIKRCAGPNTFRGFHGQTGTRKRFHDWATEFFNSGTFSKLLRKVDKPSFDAEHNKVVEQLIHYWEDSINYGQAAKLVNLVVRFACQSPNVSQVDFDNAIKYIHVPLDQCVLTAVRICVMASPKAQEIRAIPKRASMGWVTNKNQYIAIQEFLRDLAKKAGVHPIVIDYTAWTLAH